MTFLPTPSQREAIETIECPLAVTAGAGSGKTRVLVERYLNLVNQGVSTGQIAAITFTKKAAQEMKDRLREARPDLTTELEQAQISTIHSLCQRVVAEHPLEAAIDPRFRIGEGWENRALLFQIVQKQIEDSDLPEEIDGQDRAIKLVLDLYQTMRTKGASPEEITIPLGRQGASVSAELFTSPLYHAVETLMDQQPTTARQKETVADLLAEWPLIQELLNFPDLDLQLEALAILGELIGPIRGKLAEYTAPIKELIAHIQQEIQLAKGAQVIAWLAQILKDVHLHYGQAKRERGILDFNDLEILALELLSLPHVRAQYDFLHLMVDEFQDTNPIQKQIVDCFVKQGALLFVVGDPKQSIYRFRGADVGVFIETKKEIDKKGRNIFLAENFRSRPELIEFTNYLFPQIMEGGSIPFEASKVTRERMDQPCVTFFRTSAQDLNLEQGREQEAEQIALKIRKLVDGGNYKYEEIALLFRTTTNVRIYERALQAAGIPYVNLSGRGFYSQQEIKDVLHYFSWLQDPEDEVAQLAVLRSPFYLLSDQALFWIQKGRVASLSEADKNILNKSKEDYAKLKYLMQNEGAPQVITAMLARTNYLKNTWRLPFGPQKVANVEKLLEQSWQLYSQGLLGAWEQLRFIELMSEDSRGEGEALLDAEHADVVVLMTVHGAKGLEFPVVFLPDTSGGLFRPQADLILYHPHFGLTYKGTKDYDTVKEIEQDQEREELKRLLYVAITRAEERLYLCGLDDLARARESWWRWLLNALPDVPSGLYREVVGDFPSSDKGLTTNKAGEYEVLNYKPLRPQYHQVSFSVTSLMNYVRCPRYFYLRYILQVPELTLVNSLGDKVNNGNGLTAVERGNIVHRVCEQIEELTELDELLNYAAQMEGITLDNTLRSQLTRIIQPYLESEFFRRVQTRKTGEVYREREFIIPVGQFLINGLVDQVFVSSSGLEVVDFKSNWIKQSQVAEVGSTYSTQLRLYAWAMGQQFDLPVLKSLAYFLIPNAVFELEQEFLDLEKTGIWVQEICEEIILNAETGWDAFSAGIGCENCEQLAYCGKFGSFGENRDDHWVEEELM